MRRPFIGAARGKRAHVAIRSGSAWLPVHAARSVAAAATPFTSAHILNQAGLGRVYLERAGHQRKRDGVHLVSLDTKALPMADMGSASHQCWSNGHRISVAGGEP